MNVDKIYVKMLILSQLLIECNDDLMGTDKYKRELKGSVNRNIDLLEKIVMKDGSSIYNANPEWYHNFTRGIESLVHELRDASLEDFLMISSMIDDYKNKKEWFLENYKPAFKKLNQ